ncbi:uncharacterized protein LOC104002727 [Pan troglodytes]|uniref:uncharacterized protein LOC104002727 n=1 Tax=Pan troglodytes TaxID=9598 RepID=UPI000511D7F5|nr:uncharacterized protein LOC104002727 [Pan troglodytes]
MRPHVHLSMWAQGTTGSCVHLSSGDPFPLPGIPPGAERWLQRGLSWALNPPPPPGWAALGLELPTWFSSELGNSHSPPTATAEESATAGRHSHPPWAQPLQESRPLPGITHISRGCSRCESRPLLGVTHIPCGHSHCKRVGHCRASLTSPVGTATVRESATAGHHSHLPWAQPLRESRPLPGVTHIPRGHSHCERVGHCRASLTSPVGAATAEESATARRHSHPPWAQPPQKSRPLPGVTHISRGRSHCERVSHCQASLTSPVGAATAEESATAGRHSHLPWAQPLRESQPLPGVTHIPRGRSHCRRVGHCRASLTSPVGAATARESATARRHSHPPWAQPPQKSRPLPGVTHISRGRSHCERVGHCRGHSHPPWAQPPQKSRPLPGVTHIPRGHSHRRRVGHCRASLTSPVGAATAEESATAGRHSRLPCVQPPQKSRPLPGVTHVLVSGDLWEWPLRLQSWSLSKGKNLRHAVLNRV